MKTKFIRFKVRLVRKLNKLKVFFAIRGNRKIASKFTEQSKALPCPFCGEDKELALKNSFGDSFGNSWLYCYACEGYGPTRIGEQAARLAWNTRAPLLTPEQIDMLERMESNEA